MHVTIATSASFAQNVYGLDFEISSNKFLFVITQNSHGCWFFAEGACIAALKIFVIFSSSTFLSKNFLTLALFNTKLIFIFSRLNFFIIFCSAFFVTFRYKKILNPLYFIRFQDFKILVGLARFEL